MTLAMPRVSRLETAALGMHELETEKKAQHTSIVWCFNRQAQHTRMLQCSCKGPMWIAHLAFYPFFSELT